MSDVPVPVSGRIGTLKTPSCPWPGYQAVGLDLETGQLSCHYIAELSLNVMLNLSQPTNQPIYSLKIVNSVCL